MVVKGKIEWISGPAVKASGMAASKMYEVVEVGEEKLVGEVIKGGRDVAFARSMSRRRASLTPPSKHEDRHADRYKNDSDDDTQRRRAEQDGC